MGKNSAIEWTDHSWNPWLGCSKVSAGCAACYAEALMDKRLGRVVWGPTGTRQRTSAAYWRQPLLWNREADERGVRAKVFCASLADVFEDRSELEPWREDFWNLIDETPRLDWLLLTKRPRNIYRMLPDRWIFGGLPRHIWLGVSAEDQNTLDERWAILDGMTHHLAPRILFLSLEPLLEPVNMETVLTEIDCGDEETNCWTRMPDWVIIGSESGSGARPMREEWVRRIIQQCQMANVPVFYKQKLVDGRKVSLPEIDGRRWAEFPAITSRRSGT